MTRRALRVFAFALLAACGTPAEPVSSMPEYTADPHSHARPAEARVRHVALDLAPDFATRKLSGTARLAIERAPGADSVVLDVSGLSILGIRTPGGDSLAYRLGTHDAILGQALTVHLPPAGDTVVVAYETDPGAAAVQWLEPSMTAGRKLPFLFTQGEAIYTRTWIPTQDSPGIRQTYDAVLRVPAAMRAVMSAEHVGTDGETDSLGRAVYRFRMDHPIPPYLIALAVGDLAFRAIGPRTGVYAEPSVVERAAHEFAEVDSMIAAAEKLYGPYRWGRYDLLVLPPSFPLGGMENPRLTFATPTILAGDRSLVSLVAHELAHSWSGNLVTNANWNDFWLNEGFTTYIEARIMEALRGAPYAEMQRLIGRQDLAAAVTDQGGPGDPRTRLHLDLAGHDPDDATNDIAYEKGSAFLQTVESVVGRERLDAFLREYFDHFAFQPMTSERLVAWMREKLFRGDEADKVGLQTWIYEPGIPANLPALTSTLFQAVDREVKSWQAGASANSLPADRWSTQEWLHFLRALPDTIAPARLRELDRTYGLSASGNSEIQFAWFVIAIRNRYEPAFPALERFLTSQGRRKFVRPLYTQLAATPWGGPMAMAIYRKARPSYHPLSVNSIDPILKWTP